MDSNIKNSGKSKVLFRGFISGNILRRPEVKHKLPYVLFIALLMLLYIANGYYTQRLHRKYIRLSGQVKELRTKSLSITEIRMTKTRQSEVIKELEERGIMLVESVTPPKIVE